MPLAFRAAAFARRFWRCSPSTSIKSRLRGPPPSGLSLSFGGGAEPAAQEKGELLAAGIRRIGSEPAPPREDKAEVNIGRRRTRALSAAIWPKGPRDNVGQRAQLSRPSTRFGFCLSLCLSLNIVICLQ